MQKKLLSEQTTANSVILFESKGKFSTDHLNLNNIDTYTGIDTIQLLIPESEFIILDSNRFFLNNFKDKYGNWREQFKAEGFIINKRKFSSSRSFYSILFSVSTLLNGVNLSSDTPINVHDLIELISNKFERFRVKINDWSRVNISRIDIFRNVILNINYKEYSEFFNAFKFLKTKRNYENTTYYSNKQACLCIYDKSEQIELKLQLVPSKQIIRFEIRLKNSKKVRANFKTFNHQYDESDSYMIEHLENFDCDQYFISQFKKILKPIMNFQFVPASSSLKREIKHYFCEKRNRNPRRIAEISFDLLTAYRAGNFDKFVKENAEEIIPPTKIGSDPKKRINKIKNRAHEYLLIALAIEGTIKQGKPFIEDLLNGLCNPRARPT